MTYGLAIVAVRQLYLEIILAAAIGHLSLMVPMHTGDIWRISPVCTSEGSQSPATATAAATTMVVTESQRLSLTLILIFLFGRDS